MAAPTIIQADALPWETWRDPALAERSPVRWKDLIGRERGASQAMSLGIAEIPPGTTLARHRHAAPEIYYLLSGTGNVEVDGIDYPVAAGVAVFRVWKCAQETRKPSAPLFHWAKCLAMLQICVQPHKAEAFPAWNSITMRLFHNLWRRKF